MKPLKTFLLSAMLLALSPVVAFSQNAKEIKVKLMKDDQPALIATYNAPKDVVEDAIKDRFDKANFGKRKTTKGYSYWKEVSWPEVTSDKLDVYIKVDGKNNESTVTMLVSKGYDNFVSTTSDALLVQKLKDFLASFTQDVEKYQLRLDIAAAEKLTADRENDFNKQVNNSKDIEKEIQKLQQKLEDSRKDEAKKRQEWDVSKQNWQVLKGKL